MTIEKEHTAQHVKQHSWSQLSWPLSYVLLILLLLGSSSSAWLFATSNDSSETIPQDYPHIIRSKKQQQQQNNITMTLRDILADTDTGYHLALAPAFFGFYGYYGALTAWEDMATNSSTVPFQQPQSVAGASAGAMAAVFLASGISPRDAADFSTSVQLPQFNDFPGVGAVFRGEKFEQLLLQYMMSHTGELPLLETAKIPVAVSVFDLQTLEGKILTRGSMARAARASATFPLLLQPVGWADGNDDYVFIDGGIADMHGIRGLSSFLEPSGKKHRIINLKVGGFRTKPPGPSKFAVHGTNDTIVEVITISLQNLPQPGPWALEKGAIAVEAARNAMAASLDVPLFRRRQRHHYELHIDTNSFWQ